jgi:hypothetical protein
MDVLSGPCDHVVLSHEQVSSLSSLCLTEPSGDLSKCLHESSEFEHPIFVNRMLHTTTPEISLSLIALESVSGDLAEILRTPLLAKTRQATQSSSSSVPMAIPLLDTLALSSVRLTRSLSHDLSSQTKRTRRAPRLFIPLLR